MVKFSNWEQQTTAKYPQTNMLHWHKQDPEWMCRDLSERIKVPSTLTEMGIHDIGDKAGSIKCDEHAAKSGSLFCALAYFFEHFTHDALLKEYPAPAEPINTPKTLEALENLPKSELQPPQYLRWMAILIGDLHQPLHWLSEWDYGRKLKVSWKGNEYSLNQLWEDVIINHANPLPSNKALKKHYKDWQPKYWNKVPPQLFREWAKEVAQRVCTQVYGGLGLHGQGKNALHDPDSGEALELDDETFQSWVRLAEELTSEAGERLAFIFEDILEHYKHKMAIKLGRGHIKKSWTKDLGINAALAVIVVPSLLLLFRMSENGSLNFLFRGAGGHLKY
eukprot:TRINITY_DN51817_c0_g1_i1.p1 TRINITY_DN51817_c0_g1~~TRINITY_DN51817_c0_g1_i1.p1  ORF type:complete len:370 (+),score=57.92 TRINITY_DN51817_c0_g1_i1:107-1111(+)